MHVSSSANIGCRPDPRADDRSRSELDVAAQAGMRVHQGGRRPACLSETRIEYAPRVTRTDAEDEVLGLRGEDLVDTAKNAVTECLDPLQIFTARRVVDEAHDLPGGSHGIDGVDDMLDLATEAAGAHDDDAFHADWASMPRNSGIVASLSAVMPSRRST